ncbi:MAG: small ribosomal subunit biogenesis GTPase RsgA [Gammaproteobacteria bacterium]|nr:small ribosomal subunit biogenesis GTPase RsgA [Gammaproteobacteria bacterium]
MSSRKLSRQQQWRIEKIQQDRSQRAQRREQHLNDQQGETTAATPGEEEHGLIIANFGATAVVESSSGTTCHCSVRQNLGRLVVGDRVVWQRVHATSGVISALTPRHTLLSAPDSSGAMRPVAANVEQIIIVMAPLPLYSELLIDQYLVAAELTQIPPLILLNKCDLISSSEEEAFHALILRYRHIGYPLLPTSIHNLSSLDQLWQQLAGKTSVFVGQSGVGKSSLINRLRPDLSIATTPLSDRSNLGQHTTSTSQLYHLPQQRGGGTLIDSPGVRNFSLWPVDATTLLHGFIEMRPFIGHCRFRNCRHQQEPDCAIKNAVTAGEISTTRLMSYQQMVATMTAE